jgi:uncharacterized protein (TIGR00369 family)
MNGNTIRAMQNRSSADLRALVEKVTALPGYTQAAGTQVLHVEAGEVHLGLPCRADLVQFNGFFHGGVVSGLADHAAGAAVTTLLDPDRIAVTVDLHVNFLAPAHGERLVAQARALPGGKTLGVARVELFIHAAHQATLCAIATVTLRSVTLR